MSSNNAVEPRARNAATTQATVRRIITGVILLVGAAVAHAQDGYVFSTIAGKAGAAANIDGTGSEAHFERPQSIALASDTVLYVADYKLRKIEIGAETTVSTLTGLNAPLTTIPITADRLVVARDGSVIFVDAAYFAVRRWSNGELTTLRQYALLSPAQNGAILNFPADGGFPETLAVGPSGTIYVAGEFFNLQRTDLVPRVDQFTPDGSPQASRLGVVGVPRAMAVDGADDLVIVDADSANLMKLSVAGERTVVAGGRSGATDGVGTEASFKVTQPTSTDAMARKLQIQGPAGLAVDAAHNMFFADTLNHTIRRVTPEGRVTTIAGVAGDAGSQDGIGAVARFNSPSGIAVDRAGVLYIADAGNYTIRKGVPGYLPKFTIQPQSGSVKVGETVTLSAMVATNTLATKYQWQKDGVPIVGATGATLAIPNAQTSDAGSYAVVAMNDLGSLASSVANVTVDVPSVSRIVNVSIRTGITPAAPMVTVGFVVGGGSKPLLVRTVGPKLKEFGVGDAIADPKLALFKGATQMAANDNWSSAANASDVAGAAKQVGAFALTTGAADAALLTTLNGSAYTVQATGVAGATGTALVEVYDVDPASGGRLVNVSSRAQVGTGDNVLMAGFAVSGTAKKTLLIRAVGPTLATFGVAGALSDPKIELIPAGGTTAIATNDNWAGDPALAAAFTSVGAFPFATNDAKDAALVVTVSPGSYSAKVSGVNAATGEALVEIYELP